MVTCPQLQTLLCPRRHNSLLGVHNSSSQLTEHSCENVEDLNLQALSNVTGHGVCPDTGYNDAQSAPRVDHHVMCSAMRKPQWLKPGFAS